MKKLVILSLFVIAPCLQINALLQPINTNKPSIMQQELAKRRSEIINKINELFNYPTGMPAYTFSYLNVSGPGQVLAQIMTPSGTPIGTQEYNWKELRFYAPSATT